jgi:hypothetical protein
MKKENENHYNNESCQTGGCKCAANYIWIGIAVILFIMAIAMIFGN